MVFGELRTKSMVTTVIERSLQTHSNNLKMPSAYSEVMDSSACMSPITSAFERRSRSEMEFSERMSGLWAPISDGDHLGMPFGLVVDDLEPFSRASQTVDYAYPDFGPGVEVEEDEMGRAIASGGNDLDPAAYKNMLHMAGISLSDGVFTATRSAGGFVGGAASDVLVPVVHALGYAMMAIIVVIILCILLFIAYRTSWGNGKRMLLSNKMRDTRQRIRDGCVRCRRKPKDKAEAPEGERLYPQIE